MKTKYYSGSFDAPWSPSLMWISWGATAMFVGFSIFLISVQKPGVWFPSVAMNCIWLLTALFTVRGYRLQDQTLYVQRLIWETRIDLRGLEKAYQEPEAFRRCFKTFGNGGLFSFSGYFRSKKLGTFRCWVTDTKKSVVLEVKGKKLVISPDSPESFLLAVSC